jgi:hypothetical protein
MVGPPLKVTECFLAIKGNGLLHRGREERRGEERKGIPEPGNPLRQQSPFLIYITIQI